MEYKLCKDYDNMIRCDNDCRGCANEVYNVLTSENKSLKKTNMECLAKIGELEKQLEWANENIESLNNKVFDDGFQIMSKNQKIMELEEKCAKLDKENAKLDKENAKLDKENAKLDKECEKLHSDNSRLAHTCKDYIEKNSELVMENDKLRTMNSELIHRNRLLTKTTGPVIFQHAYGELSDKIEGLKEDIIRLDKCLSNRPCVKEERYGE